MVTFDNGGEMLVEGDITANGINRKTFFVGSVAPSALVDGLQQPFTNEMWIDSSISPGMIKQYTGSAWIGGRFGGDIQLVNPAGTNARTAIGKKNTTDNRFITIQEVSGPSASFLQIVPNGAPTDWGALLALGYTDDIADTTNFSRLVFASQISATKYVINAAAAGTGVVYPIDLQMGGTSIITLNTNNTVNANSRAWSNFKLGSQMDANGQAIDNLSGIFIDQNSLGSNSVEATFVKSGGFSTSVVAYLVSLRSNNQDFWLYSQWFDGAASRFTNWIKLTASNGTLRFETPTGAVGSATSGTERFIIGGGVVAGSSSVVSLEQFLAQRDNTGNIVSYRPNSTVGTGTSFRFDQWNASSAQVTYAEIFGLVVANTAGSQSGKLSFRTMSAGTLKNWLELWEDGTMHLYESAGVKNLTFKHDGTNAIIDVSSGALVFGPTATVVRPYNDSVQQLGGSANFWSALFATTVRTANLWTKDGTSVLTLTDVTGAVNANSRLWTNFKLGGGMDANGQIISNVASFSFYNSNGASVSNDQGGSMDLGAGNSTAAALNAKPYIDFHFGLDGTTVQDYNIRIQNDADKQLSIYELTGGVFFRFNSTQSLFYPNTQQSIVLGTAAATAGATLKDSSILYFRSRYWDGAQSQNYDAYVKHVMDAVTPASHIRFGNQLAVGKINSDGSYEFKETTVGLGLRLRPVTGGTRWMSFDMDVDGNGYVNDVLQLRETEAKFGQPLTLTTINVTNIKANDGTAVLALTNATGAVDALSRTWSNFVASGPSFTGTITNSSTTAKLKMDTVSKTLNDWPGGWDKVIELAATGDLIRWAYSTNSIYMGIGVTTDGIFRIMSNTTDDNLGTLSNNIFTVNANAEVGINSAPVSGVKLTVAGHVSISTNKLKTGNVALYNDTDSRIVIARSETGPNNYSAIQVVPIGTGASSIRTAIDLFGTDKIADSANYERLTMRATDSAGTPSGYIFNVDKGGTGSLRTLKIQMSANDILTFNTDNTVAANARSWTGYGDIGYDSAAVRDIKMGTNDIITFNTDNSVNANSRLWSNFKLGSQMDANTQDIVNVANLKGNNSGTASLVIASFATNVDRQIKIQTNTTGSVLVDRMVFTGAANQGAALITSYEPFQFEQYQDFKVIVAPSSPASGYGRVYVAQLDSNNEEIRIKVKKNGTVQEVVIA